MYSFLTTRGQNTVHCHWPLYKSGEILKLMSVSWRQQQTRTPREVTIT